MANLLTQPYKRPKNPQQDNAAVTLSNDFDLAQAAAAANAGVPLAAYRRFHPNGKSRLWAVQGNAVGLRAWTSLRTDDLVLFHGDSRVYAYGFVTVKVYWPGNNSVWPSGHAWDYLYGLRDVVLIPESDRPLSSDIRSHVPSFNRNYVAHHDLTSAGLSPSELLTLLLGDSVLVPPEQVASGSATPQSRTAKPPTPQFGVPATGFTFEGFKQRADAVVPNWEALERGTVAHGQVVLQLEGLVQPHAEPRYGTPPINFDLAWERGADIYVCEVKSLTSTNQSGQIRLGLGQVLDYRWRLSLSYPGRPIHAVLAVEQQPLDSAWEDICQAVGVTLTWPDRMPGDLGL